MGGAGSATASPASASSSGCVSGFIRLNRWFGIRVRLGFGLWIWLGFRLRLGFGFGSWCGLAAVTGVAIDASAGKRVDAIDACTAIEALVGLAFVDIGAAKLAIVAIGAPAGVG